MTHDPRLPWRFEQDLTQPYVTHVFNAAGSIVTGDDSYDAVNAYAKMRAALTSIATHDDARNAKRLAIDALKSVGDAP